MTPDRSSSFSPARILRRLLDWRSRGRALSFYEEFRHRLLALARGWSGPEAPPRPPPTADPSPRPFPTSRFTPPGRN